jgi:hypothetical protein
MRSTRAKPIVLKTSEAEGLVAKEKTKILENH